MTEFINILIGGLQENQSIKTDGVSTCLCSSMGMGGGYVPMIVLADKSKVESRKSKVESRKSKVESRKSKVWYQWPTILSIRRNNILWESEWQRNSRLCLFSVWNKWHSSNYNGRMRWRA